MTKIVRILGTFAGVVQVFLSAGRFAYDLTPHVTLSDEDIAA